MNKGTVKITVMFSLTIFITIIATLFSSGGIYLLLYHFGLLRSDNPHMFLFDLSLVSISVGIVLSAVFTRKILAPVINISEAAREVTGGNFSVQVDEDCLSSEVSALAHNFNLMTQELAGMETFRNDFISNVSHEFKTPLSAIEGYATLLQNPNLSSEKQGLYISKILYNTKRLTNLTGNILELSRLENQEIDASRSVFSLDEQLRQIILLFQDEWQQKHLDFDVDLEAADYFGNPALLAEVWQNLVGNAVKFVSDGGKIHVYLRSAPDKVIVKIIDNGPGMNEATLRRIFEKFYQGDTSHSGEGNGLGLTLARRIVDLHKGTIEAESEEGKGTAFTVTLPKSEAGIRAADHPAIR